MDNANIKLVRDIYAAFGRRDIPAVLEKLAPDVSWGLVGREEDVPFAGIREGRDGAASFFKRLKETQEITRFEPQRLVAAEDLVFVFGRAAWVMRASGVAGENEWLHVFTIRDDQVVKYRGHQDTGLLAAAYHAAPATKRAVNA